MGQVTADARAVVAREIAEVQEALTRRLAQRETVAREIGETVRAQLGQWWTLRPRFGASTVTEADTTPPGSTGNGH
jgi:hypothetical protein